VPATCGAATCGIDVAIVRSAPGGVGGGGGGEGCDGEGGGVLEVRVMELNARTTMSHYALAAKRRLTDPAGRSAARRFAVVRVSGRGFHSFISQLKLSRF